MEVITARIGEQERAAMPLQPLAPLSSWSKVHRAAFHGPERWWMSLAMWLAIGCCCAAAWGVLA